MPLEIEIKLKVESHDAVRARLRAVGAEPLGQAHETNIFFDRPDGSLRAGDCGLRVRLTRTEGRGETAALLTFKGPAASTGLRAREAYDLKVMPAEQVMPLLEALGFARVFSFEKERESWAAGGAGAGRCLVELDTLPVFGRFIEIEGPGEEAVRAVQEDLGLGEMSAHEASYAKMVGEWVRGQGRTSLTF